MTTTITSTPSCFQILASTSTTTALNQVVVCGTTQPPTTAAAAVVTGRKRREALLIDGRLDEEDFELEMLEEGDGRIAPSKVKQEEMAL